MPTDGQKHPHARRVWRTKSCLFHPAPPLVQPPSSHFPRKAEIFVCLPGATDEFLPLSPGAVPGSAPFKPFPPEGGNICVPAGCDGRNSAFFTRHRLWYSPIKPFSPEGGNICVPAGCGGRNPVFFTRHCHPAFRNPPLRSSKSSVTAFFIASRNRKCYDTVMIDQLKAGAHNVPLQSERTGCHIRQSCIRGFAECEVFISRGYSGRYR